MTVIHPPTLNSKPANMTVAALTIGFATAVAMWVLWVILHHPALHLPPIVIGPILLISQICSVAWWIRRVSSRQVRAGVVSGLCTGIINCLLLGSMVSTQLGDAAAPGAEGLPTSAPLVFGLFIIISGALGGIGGAIGAAMGPTPSAANNTQSCWLARFALVNAVSVVPLLTLGGAVTSANAGLSVPDWPNTYGANMFLYPIRLMAADPRVFLEHAHRLFGSFIGFTAITLFLLTLAIERRMWTKVFAGGLLLAVVIQGVVGGMWVRKAQEAGIEPPRWLPVMHGVVAQLYFAGTVAFAAAISVAFARVGPDPLNSSISRLAKMSKVLMGVLIVQLAMGAMYRHMASRHALFTHIGVAFIVVILASITGARLKKAAKDGVQAGAALSKIGGGLAHTAGLQFVLGWIALLVVLTAGPRINPVAGQLATTDVVSVWHALTRTAHQANGALLLAATTLAAVWTARIAKASAAAT